MRTASHQGEGLHLRNIATGHACRPQAADGSVALDVVLILPGWRDCEGMGQDRQPVSRDLQGSLLVRESGLSEQMGEGIVVGHMVAAPEA